jgi:hypothetical protein
LIFKDLINRIQCTRVQYRDSNLVETNEDTTSDRIGDFFAGLLDLEISTETPYAEPESKNLNETVVCESRQRTDIALLPIVEDEIDSEVFDEEEAVEVRHETTVGHRIPNRHRYSDSILCRSRPFNIRTI